MIWVTLKDESMILYYRKKRIIYLLAVFFIILLGLASRKYSHLLHLLIAQNAGDFLWSMMVYFGFRFIFVRKSSLTAIFLSFWFSFGIEFSQLYQAEWINQIRDTFLGALIFGKGFLLIDLIRYTAGIFTASVLDKWIRWRLFNKVV